MVCKLTLAAVFKYDHLKNNKQTGKFNNKYQ